MLLFSEKLPRVECVVGRTHPLIEPFRLVCTERNAKVYLIGTLYKK